MLTVVLLALLNLVFGIFFLYLFFFVNKMERRLNRTLEHIEINLLNQYGEVSSKDLKEESLDD